MLVMHSSFPFIHPSTACALFIMFLVYYCEIDQDLVSNSNSMVTKILLVIGEDIS